MADVRTARKRLNAALSLLHHPIPEHHQDVRDDLLFAYQTLTHLAELDTAPLRKVRVYQDFRLHQGWARGLIEEALECLEEVQGSSKKHLKKLIAAADCVQDAYLLI